MSQPEPPAEPAPQTFDRNLYYSLLAGLTPLIPVPYVDEYARTRVRRRMLRRLFAHYGLEPSETQLVLLLHGRSSRSGCLLSLLLLPLRLLRTLVLYPLKRLLRKILFVLTLKECTDVVATSYHLGYWVDYALASSRIAPTDLQAGPRALRHLHATLTAAHRELDPSPARQVIRSTLAGSRALLQQGGARLRHSLRQARRRNRPDEAVPDDLETPEGGFSALRRELEQRLWQDTAYRRRLEALFDKHWQAVADTA